MKSYSNEKLGGTNEKKNENKKERERVKWDLNFSSFSLHLFLNEKENNNFYVKIKEILFAVIDNFIIKIDYLLRFFFIQIKKKIFIVQWQ
jgi:hypothetical protein